MSAAPSDSIECAQWMLLVITRASCETFIRSDLKKNSTSKEGTYSCECHSGFVESFDDCIDIDECSLSINTCDRKTSTCLNIMGAFTCECLPGYERLVRVQKIYHVWLVFQSVKYCKFRLVCGSVILYKKNFDSDGNKTCTEVNMCLTNLHDCSANANCHRNG